MTHPAPNPQSTSNSTAQTPMRQSANGGTKHRALTLPSASMATPNYSVPSLSAGPSPMSLQCSPDGPRPQDGHQSGWVSPLQLPASISLPSPLSTGQSLIGEPSPIKPQGIIRRLSGRAANRFVRKQSSSNMGSRDQSTGPLVTRRRSGSKAGYESDLVTEEESSVMDESELVSPIDYQSITIPFQDTQSITAVSATSRKSSRVEDYGPPIIPEALQTGSLILKVTKKKRRTFHFKLDPQAAKVTWKSASKSLYIDDIQAIRKREISKEARDTLDIPQHVNENLWLTIVYTDDKRSKDRMAKTLNLIFDSDTDFMLWSITLENLSKYRQDLMRGLAGPGFNENTLRNRWNQEMDKVHGQHRSNVQEVLNFEGVQRLCHSLHINWSPVEIQTRFNRADSNDSGYLHYEQFRNFVKDAKTKKDVMQLFNGLRQDSFEGLDIATFLKFLEEEQGMPVKASPAEYEAIFFKFVNEDKPSSSTQTTIIAPLMNFSAFNAFLSSPFNSVLSSSALHTKLDRPLNEYFISSSHNTYLLGRQIVGTSSIEGYIRALQDGCRCVEIDCWDGGDRPVVTHGRTKTTSILFSDCISVISKYAFDASPYPLILSLEVHCKPPNQQRMVDIMEKEFGERLVKTPVFPLEKRLPSPEDLRGKILIKVKTKPPTLTVESKSPVEKKSFNRRQRSLSSPQSVPANVGISPFPPGVPLSSPPSMSPLVMPSPVSYLSSARFGLSSASDDSDVGANPRNANRGQQTKSDFKLIDNLDRLGVYTRGLKFRGNLTTDTYNHIFSLAESAFNDACQSSEQNSKLEKHNVGCLMRVYPAQTRFKSSNFDPINCWKRGVQMTAMNYQTYDEGMQLNEAMFSSGTDWNGYVLKPRALRPLDAISEHIHESLTPKTMTRTDFLVEVKSAQYLPRARTNRDDIPSPYVEVQVYIPDDRGTGGIQSQGGWEVIARENKFSSCSVRRRTGIVQSNGYDPAFDCVFNFSVRTKHPELVFIRWSVWNSENGRSYNDERNEPEATFTAKLVSLQTGYRHLPLRNHNGELFSFSTLFCRIVKGESAEVLCEEPNPIEKSSLFRKAGQRIGFGKRTGSSERRGSKEN